MKCPNCGAEYAEKVAFCTVCGTKMPDEAPAQEPAAQPIPTEQPAPAQQPEAPKENPLDTVMDKLTPVAEKIKAFLSVKKNLMTVGIAIIAVLALILIISAITSGSTGFVTYDEYVFFSANDDDELVIVREGKMIETGYEYGSGVSSYRSQDGKITAFLTSEGTLAYLKGNKVTEIAEEVTYCKLSASGKAVVYESEDGLFLSTLGGEPKELENEEAMIGTLSISPDGKSVLYSMIEEGETEITLKYYNGKESVKVKDNAQALGISDGGKYIYYSASNDEGELHVYFYNAKKDEKVKLARISNDSYSPVSFNIDLSQIMINDYEGKTYISTKGKEAEKVSSKSLSIISVSKTLTVSNIVPVDDFYGKLYRGDGNVYLLDKNPDKTEKLLSGAGRVVVDDEYETLHYVDDEELFVTKVSYGEKAKDKAKLIAEDVSDFEITENGKSAYYLSDEEVFVKKANGKGEAKRVSSDDVTSSYIIMDGNDNVYFMCDEELHVVKGKKSSACVVEDCVDYNVYDGYFYAFDDEACYYVKGTKAEKLFNYSDLLFNYGY